MLNTHDVYYLLDRRAPGKAREVKIVGIKRNTVVFMLLALGIILLWRTRALLTLAIAVILGAHSIQLSFCLHDAVQENEDMMILRAQLQGLCHQLWCAPASQQYAAVCLSKDFGLTHHHYKLFQQKPCAHSFPDQVSPALASGNNHAALRIVLLTWKVLVRETLESLCE